MRVAKDQLTEKQRRFCEEFVVDYNATQAYLRVYGGSYDTANATGPKLMKDPRIKALIKEYEKESFERANITAERIAKKLAEMAFEDEKISNKDRIAAINLLQKQFALQNQKITADIDNKVHISVGLSND